MNPTRTLNNFARHIRACVESNDLGAIYDYAMEHVDSLRPCFDDDFFTCISDLSAAQLLTHIAGLIASRDDVRRDSKRTTAQLSADTLASVAIRMDETWCAGELIGETWKVDILSILASCITTPADYLVFRAESSARCYTWQVAIPMRRLIHIAVRPDMMAWVDASGLHIRWNKDDSGRYRSGYNLVNAPALDRYGRALTTPYSNAERAVIARHEADIRERGVFLVLTCNRNAATAA